MAVRTVARRFGGRSPIAFRRSPYVISYWSDGQLIVFNYATGASAPATPLALELLDALKEWWTWEDLSLRWLPEERKVLRQVVDLMVRRTLVLRSTDTPHTIERGLERWGTWNPVAALFHFATKDVQFTTDVDQQAVSCEKARSEPVPASLKTGAGGIPLPKPITEGQLPSVLLERRTWRRFGRGSLPLDNLATLLQLTWGVHGWLEVPGVSRFALKTSPSGGARHSIEVYVLVRSVAGLRRGLYHYNPDTHSLVPIKGAGPRRISDYLPGQPWYDDAGAVMLMTSVFERVQWRYPYARAYRAIMAEAGHLCQTFCLVATWLGLAPFCTMALADSRIERDLAIDGVSESVLYAAGVGIRPSGVTWAPLPDTEQVPRTTKPTHAGTTPSPGRKPNRSLPESGGR
jgi:SagB-type dehydrogenase family enzyme